VKSDLGTDFIGTLVPNSARAGGRPGCRRCSDSGDDLDPGFMHSLEPCGLHLGILVRDGRGCGRDTCRSCGSCSGARSMTILSTSISVSGRRSTADRSSTQNVAADDVLIPSGSLVGLALAAVTATGLARRLRLRLMCRRVVARGHAAGRWLSRAAARHRLPAAPGEYSGPPLGPGSPTAAWAGRRYSCEVRSSGSRRR
jgi:hypothetical protein